MNGEAAFPAVEALREYNKVKKGEEEGRGRIKMYVAESGRTARNTVILDVLSRLPSQSQHVLMTTIHHLL